METDAFQHYSEAFLWLGHEGATSAATAIRGLCVLGDEIGSWNLPETSVPLVEWSNLADVGLPHTEYKERARWVLDSSVGDLMTQLGRSLSFDDDPRPAVTPAAIRHTRLPDFTAMFTEKRVPREVNVFLRALGAGFVEFRRQAGGLPTNVYELQALLFDGLLLADMLFVALSVIDYAASLCGRLG